MKRKSPLTRSLAQRLGRSSARHANRRSAGFSLVEILIALGIFMIGMVSVVSLFPAAAILQRETNQEVIGELAAQSAPAVINAQKLTYASPGEPDRGVLGFYHGTDVSTQSDAIPIPGFFSASDRSYPTFLIDRSFTDPADQIKDSDLHWVPFIQDINGDPFNPNWVVRIFLLGADSRVTYPTGNAADANLNDPETFPKVRAIVVNAVNGDTFTLAAANHGLEAGELVMDNNGNDHIITEVNGADIVVLRSVPRSPSVPNRLWYAPKFNGTSSPARRVVTVSVDVVSP